MKKNSLLLWILIPISYMTNYIVYAESVDPLDPGVVVEEPTPTDLIEPDPVPDPTIQDEEVPVDVWAEEEPVAPSEEPVGPWEEVPVDPLEPLLDPTVTGETQPIGGGLQSALGGLQSATSPTTTPTSTGTSEEPQTDQPVITNTTSSNLIDPTSTGTSEEPQTDQPVLANTTSSNLIDPITGADEQSNSSTSNQTANTSNSTSAESQTNQPVIINTTSVNLNESGTLIENSTQTTSSSDKNKTPTATTQNSSTNSSNTTHSNSSQSNLSSSTRSNNTASKASSTQSKSNVSTTTSTSLPKSTNQDKTDELTTTTPQNNSSKSNKDISTKSTTDDNNTSTNSSVQDNSIVTTKQNASTNTDENPSGSNLSKGDLSTTAEISSVSSNAQQEKTLNESNNEPGIQTSANENESQLSTPKSEANEEGGTTQLLLNDGVVIVADNSVLPNTFSVDTQIGPHQVFLIHIGEGYSKPEVVEHLNNSQVFIKENLLTYVPHLGFVGIDTFSYQVTDPEGKKVVKQVRVKVTAKDELVPVKNCQLYFVNDSDDSDSQFLTVAPTSKIAIKLGPEYYTFDMEGMAIHPTNGLLYATSGGGRQNIFDGYLYRVNSETGGVTIIGDTGFSEISSLAFNPKEGTLWSWSRKGSKDKSKPAGLIQIDPTTAQSQLIFASPVDIEGLAWDSEGKVLYGTEQTRLWAFDGKELHQQCSNLSSEIEALETSVNGMLLLGTNEYNGSAVHLYDPAICEEVIGDSFAIPSVTGNFDIESIAWSPECQAAITKTTRSDKDSNSTKTSVDNQKATRNSKKVTSQPVTTCPSDTIGPCPALEQEEVQRFFTDNLKADFVQLDPDGLAFVSLHEQLHYGFFSYSLSAEQVKKLKSKSIYEVACEQNEDSVAQLKLGLTKDVDGEGHGDFVITYCDGQAQMLFYLGITDSVLTGMDGLETSKTKEDVKTKKDNSNQTKN